MLLPAPAVIRGRPEAPPRQLQALSNQLEFQSMSTVDPASLFEGGRIDGRVYTDPAIFELEQERIFRKVWHFVGHESEVAAAGDFLTADIMGEPLVVMRGADGVL